MTLPWGLAVFNKKGVHFIVAVNNLSLLRDDATLVAAHFPVSDELSPEPAQHSKTKLILTDGRAP